MARPVVCNDPEMPISGQVPLERADFEVRLDRRSFWRNSLFIALLFLAYVALAIFGTARLHLDAVAGVAVFGVIGLSAGLAGARQIRREPVVATLTDSGGHLPPPRSSRLGSPSGGARRNAQASPAFRVAAAALHRLPARPDR